MRSAFAVVAALGSLLIAEGGPVAAPKRKAKKNTRCFTAEVSANSPGTSTVFKRHHLQSGGPTWAAILEARVKSYTKFVREETTYTADMPGFGVPMIVSYRDALTWYVLDEEGDGAIFCAGIPTLLDATRAEYARLNSDSKALEVALAGVPTGELE